LNIYISVKLGCADLYASWRINTFVILLLYTNICASLCCQKKKAHQCASLLSMHMCISSLQIYAPTYNSVHIRAGIMGHSQRNTEHHVSQIWGGGVRKIESLRMRCFLSCWCRSKALIGYLSCASLSSKLMGRGAFDHSSATQMSWTATCRQASDSSRV